MKVSLSTPETKNLRGTLLLPSSKSISNRLLILQELCKRDLGIANLADADDTLLLRKLLKQYKQQPVLDAANAGTAMRFMTALLAVSEGEWMLSGSERMLQRPVGALVDALRQIGAEIDYAGAENFPPLRICGRPLKGGHIEVDGSISSQFASALLLIAPFLPEGLSLELQGEKRSSPYIHMTLALLRHFGIITRVEEELITVYPGSFKPQRYTVEPDWSAASYWYLAASLVQESEIFFPGLYLSSIQGDCVLASIYRCFGIESIENKDGIVIRKTAQADKKFNYDFSACPDLFPAVALSCAALGVDARLSGLGNLRVKESDRIKAVADGLQQCGIAFTVTETDELHIFGDKQIKTGDVMINSYGDHRIAMAFAQLSWLTGSIIIDDMDVSAKSYPAFVSDMKMMGALVDNFIL